MWCFNAKMSYVFFVVKSKMTNITVQSESLPLGGFGPKG